MEKVKEKGEYTFYKKKSGRFCVKGKDRKWIKGDEKAKLLLAEGLIKLDLPKEKPAEEAAPAEESAE